MRCGLSVGYEREDGDFRQWHPTGSYKEVMKQYTSASAQQQRWTTRVFSRWTWWWLGEASLSLYYFHPPPPYRIRHTLTQRDVTCPVTVTLAVWDSADAHTDYSHQAFQSEVSPLRPIEVKYQSPPPPRHTGSGRAPKCCCELVTPRHVRNHRFPTSTDGTLTREIVYFTPDCGETQPTSRCSIIGLALPLGLGVYLRRYRTYLQHQSASWAPRRLGWWSEQSACERRNGHTAASIRAKRINGRQPEYQRCFVHSCIDWNHHFRGPAVQPISY